MWKIILPCYARNKLNRQRNGKCIQPIFICFQWQSFQQKSVAGKRSKTHELRYANKNNYHMSITKIFLSSRNKNVHQILSSKNSQQVIKSYVHLYPDFGLNFDAHTHLIPF